MVSFWYETERKKAHFITVISIGKWYKIANRLSVGTKEKDNGLLILVSYYDRQVAISTGFGTEKIITDSIAKTIIEKTIIPKFKESFYFDGLNTALDSIIVKWN